MSNSSATTAAAIMPSRPRDKNIVSTERRQRVGGLVADRGRLVLQQDVAAAIVETFVGTVIDRRAAGEHARPVVRHRVLDRADLDALDRDQAVGAVMARR